MFVPHTPGGDLAKRLQEAEDRFVKNSSGGRVKFVERGGSATRIPGVVKAVVEENPVSSSSARVGGGWVLGLLFTLS